MAIVWDDEIKSPKKIVWDDGKNDEGNSLLKKGGEFISNSPALPIVGGVVGGILGNIPGAALGAAGGEAWRQNIARGLGYNAPETSGEAVKKIATQGAIGGIGEGIGLAARPILSPVARFGGRALAGGVEKITGIPAQNTINAFTNPLSILTAPTQKAVSKAYSESEFPVASQSLSDILEKGSTGTARFVRRGAKAIEEYVEKGVENAKTILEGRHALDKEIALLQNQLRIARRGTGQAIQDAIDAKTALRQTFNRALDKMAPKFRAADAVAAERFQISPFRELTLPGKINLFSTEGILRAVPGLPTVLGGAISTAGAGAKTASALSRPILQAASQSLKNSLPKNNQQEKMEPSKSIQFQGGRQIKPPLPVINIPLKAGMAEEGDKQLTPNKAREFLKQANGDKNLARKLAREAGYTF